MFGLNPDLWMDGQHCLNGEWILDLMIIGSIITLIFYFTFCVFSFILWRMKNTWTSSTNLFLWLSIVFFFCGIIHASHGMGKIIPELYLGVLTYPFLFVAMLVTLLSLIKIYEKNKYYLSNGLNKEVQERIDRLEELLEDNRIDYNNSGGPSGKQCSDCNNNHDSE